MLVLAGVAAALWPTVVSVEADRAPDGFDDVVVAKVEMPTALAFIPDGRMLVTTQPGRLHVLADGRMVPTPALDLSAGTCTRSEQGLLGVAVDPKFSANRFVYLFYTFDGSECVNRVSRFVLHDRNVVDPSSEVVLLDNMPSPNGNHNGGDLQFGPDGYLYVTVGEGGCDYAGGGCNEANDAARDRQVLLAKVLRITAEGGIPPDNPFLGPDSARCNRTGRTDPGKTCQETFAWGLRNPFRLAFDPNAEGIRLFVNDVGQDHFEEINEVKAGADYGWNVREGPCAVLFSPDRTKDPVCDPHPADMTDPVYAYRHTEPTGCQTITGGAFVPEGIWPPAYDGAYLFGDFLCGKIFQLTPKAGGGFERSEFLSDLGPASVIYLTFGPHHATQSLYYTTYTNGGEVRRVDYVGGQNRPPTAAVVAEPAFGPPALTVTFDGSASRDPDRADRLAYSWDFGDGTPVGWSTQARTAHTYEKVGRYTATLRVRDGREGVSQAATTVVAVGDSPPVPRIEGPAVGHLFSVDEPITLMGAAADAEEGVLPSGQLTWTVILHHAGRSHPYLGPVTSSPVMFIAPAPTSLAAARDSYLELRLTATDSAGLTATVTQDLRPRLVEIALQAEPRGLDLIADGVTFTAPETFVSWQGYPLPIWAPDQERSGRRYAFVAWGDHPTPTRTIVTPPVPSAYTAYFLPAD